MEEFTCIICGREARVPRGTPPLERVCAAHQGEVPPVVGILRTWVGPEHLAAAVERNAAQATIEILESVRAEYEAHARVNEQQIGALRNRFDRERSLELTAERRVRLEYARHLRGLIGHLRLLAPED